MLLKATSGRAEGSAMGYLLTISLAFPINSFVFADGWRLFALWKASSALLSFDACSAPGSRVASYTFDQGGQQA